MGVIAYFFVMSDDDYFQFRFFSFFLQDHIKRQLMKRRGDSKA